MNQPLPRNADGQKILYHSYLLRLWCAGQAEVGCWQASLDDPHTGERIGFASLEEMFTFLIEQVEAPRRADMGACAGTLGSNAKNNRFENGRSSCL